MLVCDIEQGGRVPLEDAAFGAAGHVLGFLATASIGHAVAMWFLTAARSRLLTGRSWRYPVVCAIAVFGTAILVEPTADVLGEYFDHRSENLMAAGSVFFWSATEFSQTDRIRRLGPVSHCFARLEC
jgi:hypothetical protein